MTYRRGQVVSPTTSAVSTAHVTAGDFSRNQELVRDEISAISDKVDAAQVAAVGALIVQVNRVFIAGAGRSGLVLRMAAMRLMHLGLTVYIAGDATTPAITGGDLLLVASGSGTTSGVVKSAQTAAKVGARIAAFTTDAQSPLAELADAVVIIPAAQKTNHNSGVTQQYSGSLFEQALFVATEALFQSLWNNTDEPAEQLWLRHANLE